MAICYRRIRAVYLEYYHHRLDRLNTMTKYYRKIERPSKVKLCSGTAAVVPADFRDLSSLIISRCSFLQSQIQRVIFLSHGPEISAAKKFLTESPNPKARMRFLTSFQYSYEDPVISLVFNYARQLFLDIYEIRNVLTHEDWMSNGEYKEQVLFSRLDEEARLLFAKGTILHKEDATSRDVYDAILRYIQSVKIVSCADLHAAVKDADLCAWILMHITNIIDEQDPNKKEEARKAFFVFKGTSHLFGELKPTTETVTIQNSKRKMVRG